jgi:CRISPR-associated protein Cas2
MDGRDFYVLAYDIADDKRRAKIARLMESMGARVQGSVFEAYLNTAELDRLLKRAFRILDREEDSLRIYCLCEACRKKARVHGKGTATSRPGLIIV